MNKNKRIIGKAVVVYAHPSTVKGCVWINMNIALWIITSVEQKFNSFLLFIKPLVFLSTGGRGGFSDTMQYRQPVCVVQRGQKQDGLICVTKNYVAARSKA